MAKKQDDPLTALRRKRLLAWITKIFDGNKSAAAAAVGKPPTQFVDLLNNTNRSFGARIARELEEKYKPLGMPKYYFDTDDEQPVAESVPSGWPFRFSPKLYNDLDKDEKLIIEGMVLGRIMGLSSASTPAIPKRARSDGGKS